MRIRKTGRRAGIRGLCLFAALLTLAVILFIRTPQVQGATTYTVRIFSGKNGTFKNGKPLKEFKNIPYGTRFVFDDRGLDKASVKLTNDKYYVMGFRESGRDNSTVGPESFVVTKDIDYVTAYGIEGNSVKYTVSYVDENGKALAASKTFHGNLGDKPVVGARYISGYSPQAYNLTGTLQKDESKNSFRFVYKKIKKTTTTDTDDDDDEDDADDGGSTNNSSGSTSATNGSTSPTSPSSGTTASTGTATSPSGGSSSTGTAGAGTTQEADQTDEENNLDTGDAASNGEEDTSDIAETEDIDMQDEDVPLSGYTADDDESESRGLPLAAKIGIGLAAAALIATLAALIWYFKFYRPGLEEEEEDEDEEEGEGDQEGDGEEAAESES